MLFRNSTDQKRKSGRLSILEPADFSYLLIPVICGLAVTGSLLVIYRHIHVSPEGELFRLASLGILLLAVLFIGVGRYLEQYVAEVLAQRAVSRIRLRLFNKVMSSTSVDDPLHKRSSTFLRLTSDMSAIRNWIVFGLVRGIIVSVIFVSSVLLLFFVHPNLAITALVCGGSYMLVSLFLGRLLYNVNQEQRHARTRLLERASNQFESLKTIIFFNQFRKEKRRFETRSKELIRTTIYKAHISGLLRAFSEVMIWFTLMVLGFVGLNLVRNGTLTVQNLVIVLTSSVFLLHRIRSINRVFETWSAYKISLARINNLLAKPSRSKGKIAVNRSAASPLLALKCEDSSETATHGDLIVHPGDVLVRHPEDQSLDMIVAAALHRKSARGLLRIRGAAFEEVRWNEIARTIAIVSPHLPLVSDTVRKNLLYGKRKETAVSIEKLFKLLGRLPDTRSLVEKLDQPIATLSEDEVVLTGLIRAIVRNPECILFDLRGENGEAFAFSALGLLLSMFDGAVVVYPNIHLFPALSEANVSAGRGFNV